MEKTILYITNITADMTYSYDMTYLYIFLLGIVLFFVIYYFTNRADKIDKEKDVLYKYVNRSDISKWDNKKSKEWNINRFLAKRDNREKIYLRKKYVDYQDNKPNIVKRAYSFQYEDGVYQIFAPFAKKNYGSWTVSESLEVEYVIREIKEIYNVTNEKARELFDEFVKNELINFFLYDERKKKCMLGRILDSEWNVISEYDLNLSKWIELHPERESEDSARKKRKPFIIHEKIPLTVFLEKYGDFTIMSPYVIFEKMKEHVHIDITIYDKYYNKKYNNLTHIEEMSLQELLKNNAYKFYVLDDGLFYTIKEE